MPLGCPKSQMSVSKRRRITRLVRVKQTASSNAQLGSPANRRFEKAIFVGSPHWIRFELWRLRVGINQGFFCPPQKNRVFPARIVVEYLHSSDRFFMRNIDGI
jgi:hypothetical protein